MRKKIFAFIYRHRGYLETGKILILSLLALISLFVSVYVLHESAGTGFQITYVLIPHLYLIPIILIALWYPKSGLRLIGIILISLFAFWLYANYNGLEISIPFILLYAGIDLATIMVLLLYVKDRRLVEAVLIDLMERGQKSDNKEQNRLSRDFDTIIEALGNTDEYIREEAVASLSGLADERVVFPLIRALDDESMYVRRSAVEALGKSNSKKAVAPLIKSLTNDDRYIREAAAEALGHLGEIAIPDLVHNLTNKDWRIRMGSVIALRVTSSSVTTFDQIITTLSDDSPYVRREGVKTLGRIGDKSIVPYLIQATKDPNPGVRLRAVRAVAKIGDEKEVLSALKRCTQDEDGAVRVRAREELSRLEKGHNR